MNDKPALGEGIYFNLSNEDYHNDPALSHSGMTQLLVSWQDYWEKSSHNPKRREYAPTDAMKFGDRSGMYLLDRKNFDKSFNTVRNYNARGTGVCLSTIEMARIVDSIDCIMSEDIGKDHFTNGYPEVAIFWRDPETGIMLRVKIDYMRTFGAIDFKRIRGLANWDIGSAVKSQGLDIQQFTYLEGIKAGRRWLSGFSDKQLAAYAKQEGVALDWLIAFRDDTDLLFRFLFQRSTPPYIWEFRELEPDVVTEGANATREAIRRYVRDSAAYGFSKPPMGSSIVKTVSPFHVPRREYDYA